MGEQETAGEQVLEAERPEEPAAPESASAAGTEDVQQLILDSTETRPQESGEARDLAVLEAIVYVTDEPLPVQQIALALGRPVEHVQALLDKLVAEYNRPEHGLSVREVAGGYKMATKPEHHEAVRQFVKNLNPPLKLSLAALETLAVIAYKQPITAPEIMEIRGVQGAGVLKTLLDRKLITASGRKNVVGRPILYKTTKDFLVQFGLKDLNELPTLKEFEELRRLALGDDNEPVLGAASGDENPDVARQSDDPEAPPAPPPEPEEPSETEPQP
jgi:segregation and condensation protein B